MADGGQFPWRRQTIDESRGPPGRYSNLKQELPRPPTGVEWEHDNRSREWRLVVSNKLSGSTTAWSSPVVAKPVREAAISNSNSDGDNNSENDDDNRISQPQEGVDFICHTVLPTDTFQGLCLRYKIQPTRLRQINNFSGTNLRLCPPRLVIPLLAEDGSNLLFAGKIRLQDTSSPDFKMYSMLNSFPHLGESERRAYLELADWDLDRALQDAKADETWELQRKQAQQKVDVHVAVPLDEKLAVDSKPPSELEMARRK